MAKEQKKQEKIKEKEEKIEKKDTSPRYASIVRIMQTDIPGNKNILTGLTYIKGVSYSISNAICKIEKLDPNRNISDLNEKEIETLTSFLKNLGDKLPEFLLNRRNDFETGENSHLVGTDLDMKKEFDIRRLKKIRSYRGLRHATGLPTRGQRTRSNFRARGKKKAVGVKTKKSVGKKG
ncbi:30S ribosomal protein S13 [Candidatus Pacearchaeota archaeon]|nr:30S ribosomal protein S13 [Candidatus Pacearchaeota archaeon]